ncbi:MAG: hypothetical protein EON98_07310 [Chitinophagaceae bacterium]|nr:MAG: hypothetical protein EON98_07310 [Chitinophagaceae bacterium]
MRVVPSLHDKANNIHGQYFLNFSLQNVRCFGKKQTLNLSDAKGKPYPWTIILGENGVGKTTVLKGLASLAPSPGSGEAHQTKFYPGLLDWRDQWNTRRFDGKDPSVFEADTIAGHGFSKLAKDQKSHFSIQQRHVNAGDVQYACVLITAQQPIPFTGLLLC